MEDLYVWPSQKNSALIQKNQTGFQGFAIFENKNDISFRYSTHSAKCLLPPQLGG